MCTVRVGRTRNHHMASRRPITTVLMGMPLHLPSQDIACPHGTAQPRTFCRYRIPRGRRAPLTAGVLSSVQARFNVT
ncbi:uncharacterized protein B0H64DRAFT_164832 [Chaetomium fimeti]|uniref:Uncharacterized protein n=1 Tax=Chaetomium fimeti TaxID=1854472 RepID=A0AAE0HGR9_9PEZI|nr:hypothetical protein B0H64DRAFT_164832 [Chaetomium fimeti]